MSNPIQQTDSYSKALLDKFDQINAEPLSAVQRDNLEKAILAVKPKKHVLDVRGVLPFHFARLYYGFYIGKDQRTLALSVGENLRTKPTIFAQAIYWIVAIWPLYLITWFIYFILNNLPTLYRG